MFWPAPTFRQLGTTYHEPCRNNTAGMFFCKPHFDELFKKYGGYDFSAEFAKE
jgi:hypothetical protein